MIDRLAPAGDDRWHLPRHAYIVVYEREEGEGLLTVYDCGAAQKPPSARVLGNLVRVDADHDLERKPTGYVVRMRERSVLERQDEVWVVRASGGDGGGGGD